MNKVLKKYWQLRFKTVKDSLEANNFTVYLSNSIAEAKKLPETIIPELQPESISWGGSDTFKESGLYAYLISSGQFQILDTFDKTASREILMERRRQALLSDLFITGCNAVTDTGKLINLDMIGNRVSAIVFGPKHVILLVGRNKIVADVDEAMVRIKAYAAPANTMRLGKKNPCLKSGYCSECKSKERICNSWTIHEKSFPKGRIKIILINEDLGL